MLRVSAAKSSVQLDGQPKCCFFSFSNELQANRIVSAQLWFQLRPADEATTVFLQISRLSPVTDGTRHIRIRSLKIEVSAGESSWRRIDVKQVLAVWLRQPETNWGVEIKAFDSRGNDLAVTSAEPGEEGLVSHTEQHFSAEAAAPTTCKSWRLCRIRRWWSCRMEGSRAEKLWELFINKDTCQHLAQIFLPDYIKVCPHSSECCVRISE